MWLLVVAAGPFLILFHAPLNRCEILIRHKPWKRAFWKAYCVRAILRLSLSSIVPGNPSQASVNVLRVPKDLTNDLRMPVL